MVYMSIYIDHSTTRREGAEVCPVRPYLDIWNIQTCIWIHVDMVTTGPIHIFHEWGHSFIGSTPTLIYKGKTMYQTDIYGRLLMIHSSSIDYFDIR